MHSKILILIGLFFIAFVWYILMPFSVTSFYGQFIKRKRVPLSIMWTWLLILQLFVPILPFTKYFPNPMIPFIGFALYFLGIGFASWGRITMQKNWGIPAQHDFNRQNKLVTHGAFKYSRNPIYLGLLVSFIGFELVFQSWLVLLAIPAFFYIRELVKKEEILVLKYFGNEWKSYQKKVRRFL